MSGISIDKEIYKILSNDEKLKKMVGERIYAVVCNDDKVTFPFVQYSKGSVTPTTVKGVVPCDKVEFGFMVVSPILDETIEIAERIRNLFELRTSDYFYRIELQEAYEDFENDAFIQVLIFNAVTIR